MFNPFATISHSQRLGCSRLGTIRQLSKNYPAQMFLFFSLKMKIKLHKVIFTHSVRIATCLLIRLIYDGVTEIIRKTF